MKSSLLKPLCRYGGFFVLALLIIFFLGVRVDDATGDTQIAIKSDAVRDFQLGMDIAGGVKLTYRVDFSEYNETYQNKQELEAVKQETIKIALTKVQERVSELGVSDANVYRKQFDGKDFITVEIGGVHSLQKAEEIIGKTVTLSFKVPVQKVDPQRIAERKQQAQALYEQVKQNPDDMEVLLDQFGIADSQYNEQFLDVSFNQLPTIYRTNATTLKNTQANTTLPFLQGEYHTFDQQTQTGTQSVTLSGFVIAHLTDHYVQENTGSITPSQIITAAQAKGLSYEEDFTFTAPQGTGTHTTPTTVTYTQPTFEDQKAYKATLYRLPAPNLLGKEQAEIDRLEKAHQDDIDAIQNAIQNNTIPQVSGAQQLIDTQRISYNQLSGVDGSLQPTKEGLQVFKTLQTTYIIDVIQQKNTDQALYQTLTINDVADPQVFLQDVRQQHFFSLKEIFIPESPNREPATTTDNQILNGQSFKFANPSFHQVTGEPVVEITFNEEGKQRFCDITEKYQGENLGIFINDQVITAPRLNEKICGGTAIIQGSYTTDQTQATAKQLNEGAFPVKMELESEEKVPPTLGRQSLQGALIAGLVGLIAIGVLLFLFYGMRKMLTGMMVLITYLTYLLAILKLPFIGYAFSLSGIAAILLALGMAIDANILIFERTREELKKGVRIKSAIDTGVSKSRMPIKDGNFSTGLIALLLFFVGTSLFKGFGGMLILTIALVLLINVPLTKLLLHVFFHRKKDYLHNK